MIGQLQCQLTCSKLVSSYDMFLYTMLFYSTLLLLYDDSLYDVSLYEFRVNFSSSEQDMKGPSHLEGLTVMVMLGHRRS